MVGATGPTRSELQILTTVTGTHETGLFRERHRSRLGDTIGTATAPLHIHLFDLGSRARHTP